jgi:predicted RNA binding protein YcfA (HicA-like mRNA interferase family)
MPRKVRQLIADLEKAGFEFVPGKGRHRKFRHRTGIVAVISGQLGDDAKHYQEKQIRSRIQQAHEKEK